MLNTRITSFVNKCKFSHQQTKKTLKIILLQHEVRYHKSHNWVWQQDQSQLTYATLFPTANCLSPTVNSPRRLREIMGQPLLPNSGTFMDLLHPSGHPNHPSQVPPMQLLPSLEQLPRLQQGILKLQWAAPLHCPMQDTLESLPSQL